MDYRYEDAGWFRRPNRRLAATRVMARPVLALPYGRELIVIGSNFGRRAHPAWYHNLRKHPLAAITQRGVTTAVSARLLDGEERERCFAVAATIYPGFTDYPRRAAHREIGVFRLSAA